MSLLILVILIMLLCGVGFFPNQGFTPAARGGVGTVLLVIGIIWLVKYSHLI